MPSFRPFPTDFLPATLRDFVVEGAEPEPESVDEVHAAELPEDCPHCGCGDVAETDVQPQFQTEIVCEVVTRRFDVRLGHGRCCAETLQGRTGWKCVPNYEEIRRSIRGSPVVVPDETGWRIGGRSAWLHAVVGAEATCVEIVEDRSPVRGHTLELPPNSLDGRQLHAMLDTSVGSITSTGGVP